MGDSGGNFLDDVWDVVYTPNLLGLTDTKLSDITGGISGDHYKDAAAAQERAAAQANETQKYMYDQNRLDNEPWRQAGSGALSGMQNPDFQRDFGMSDFQKDPGYEFRMAEGQKAIERSAAARGGLNSGSTLKALSNYGQRAASEEYGNAYNRFNNNQTNRFNRLSSIAGLGQTANNQVNSAGQNFANQVSQNQVGVGNAQAGSKVAYGNMWGDYAKTGAGIAFSDVRVKENIREVSKADLQELKQAMKPYTFRYINGFGEPGEWLGVMAQDLEKSKLGRTVVSENSRGIKIVNQKKLLSLLIATMAEG